MNFTDLETASLSFLRDQVPTSITTFFLAPVAFLTNLAVIITIFSTPSLRNKSQYVIVSHSLAEALFSLADLIYHLRLYIYYFLSTPHPQTQIGCILHPYHRKQVEVGHYRLVDVGGTNREDYQLVIGRGRDRPTATTKSG